jgi:ribosome-binding protein aMBF1 (putative translation factor)
MIRLRIEVARKQRKWNQTKLAAAAGMSTTDVSKIENGRFIPYPKQAERLARALKIKPEELLEEVEVQGFDRRAG